MRLFFKAHVKGHYRTDPKTGRQVYVQPYDDKRPTASGEQPASQPAPATPEVPTVKLNNGREVAAKFNEGELVALTYANRTQAERKREQLGDGWEVVGGTGLIRPFYVAKVPAERAKETAPREAALSGLSDDELRRMQETGGRHERELARAALEQRRQRAAGQDPEASTMAPADLPEWLVRGAADLRRRDRIDAEHAEYPAQREDARRRLERPEQFYPPAEVMADYPDLQPQRETPPPAAASQLPIQVEHRTGQEGSVYEGDDLAALLRATKKEQRGRFRTIQTLRGTLALGTHPTTGRPLTPKQREELEKELANLEKEYAGVYEQVEQAAGDQDAQHLREQVEQPANSGRSFSIERQDPSTGQLKTQTFRVGDYVEVWLGEGRTVHGTITGISHARREAKVDGTWMEFGRIYPASQTPLSRKKQPTVPLSRSIREAEKTPPGGWKGGDQLSLFKRLGRGLRLFFKSQLGLFDQPVPVQGHVRQTEHGPEYVRPHTAIRKKKATMPAPAPADPRAHQVIRKLHGLDTRPLGVVLTEPYDGTPADAVEAARRIERRMNIEYPEASHTHSPLGATGPDGALKYVISPNYRHVAEVGTDEARYILGDLDAKPKEKARPTYPDGRLIPQAGDKVFQVVPGFGGMAAYIHGEVYGKPGKLRVRITGSGSLLGGGGYGGPKTVALTPHWTVEDDPVIVARELAEKERRQREAEERAAAKARAKAMIEESYQAAKARGELDATPETVQPGMWVTQHHPPESIGLNEHWQPERWLVYGVREWKGKRRLHGRMETMPPALFEDGTYLIPDEYVTVDPTQDAAAQWQAEQAGIAREKADYDRRLRESEEAARKEREAADEYERAARAHARRANLTRFRRELEKDKVRAAQEAATVEARRPLTKMERELADLQAVRYKTATQEHYIEVLERRLAADPAKWKVGDGVGWKVTGDQINRGFRIVALLPESKEAIIRQVADTGLTSSGGNDGLIANQRAWLGDLVRDRKYNALAKSLRPERVPVKLSFRRAPSGKVAVVGPHGAVRYKREARFAPIGTAKDVSVEELQQAVARAETVFSGDDAYQAARMEILLQPHVYRVWQTMNTDAGGRFPRIRRVADAKYGPGYVLEWVLPVRGGEPLVMKWNGVHEDYYGHSPGTAWNGVGRETLHRFVDDLYLVARGHLSGAVVDSEFMRRAVRAGLRVLTTRRIPPGFSAGERIERPSGEVVTVIGGRQELGDPETALVVRGEDGKVAELSPRAVTEGRARRLSKSASWWQRLLTKAHVKTYTRSDGTLVREHDDKRRAAQPRMPHPRRPGRKDDATLEHRPTGQFVRDRMARYGYTVEGGRMVKRPEAPSAPQTTPAPKVQPTKPAEPGRLEEWLHQIMQEPDIQQALREVSEGTPTHLLYQQADGSYTPERAKLHEAIVASMLNPRAVAQPGQRPHAAIFMGAPASGKTSALQPAAKELGVEFTVINADDIKEKLPEYTGTNAGLVHEESSHIAEGLLLDRALEDDHNVLLDVTGANTEKIQKWVAHLHTMGYEISIFYANLPIEKCCARAVDRFRRHRRFVPPNYIAKNVDGKPERTYEALKQDPRVSHWRRYSTDVEAGSTAPLQEQGQRGVVPFLKALREHGGRGWGGRAAESGGVLVGGSSRPTLRGHGGVAERPDHGHAGEASEPIPAAVLTKARTVEAALGTSLERLDWNLQSPDLDPAARGILRAERLKTLERLEALREKLAAVGAA